MQITYSIRQEFGSTSVHSIKLTILLKLLSIIISSDPTCKATETTHLVKIIDNKKLVGQSCFGE